MKVIASKGNYKILSDFGDKIVEGTLPSAAGGAGKEISFTVTQNKNLYNTVYVRVVPVDGQNADFWDLFWSNKVGGEPADEFALSRFLSLDDGKFTVRLNADRLAEGNQTFALNVWLDNMDAAQGHYPVISARFSIIDDDGGPGNDVLRGLATADYLRGGAGNDQLFGGAGNDTLWGEAGHDTLWGSTGNDSILGGDGADQLSGQTGHDTLRGGLGFDTLYGGAGNDLLNGGLSADELYGGAGNDWLLGEAGNDWLTGEAGADTLQGGAGNDTLQGGAGIDRLTGGAGADVFRFVTRTPGSQDVITDFTSGQDRIALDEEFFTGFPDIGRLRAADFVRGTAAQDASDRVIWQKSTGKLWYDPDGNGAQSKVLIAELGAGTALQASDIWIV